MGVSKKRKKKTNKVYKKVVISDDNQFSKLAGMRGNAEGTAVMRKGIFEYRETENRRAVLKATSENKPNPFVEEQAQFGYKFKVGDKVKNPLKETRRIVEVQRKDGEIFYAWVSNTSAGLCNEKTMVNYGK